MGRHQTMIGAMGIADSPLRNQVIFVEGAPRSGTTWLVTLLATHPQIAGVQAESHLFDFGVDQLFDNFEGRGEPRRGLRTYLEREQLVDLTRDLCDGVLLAMRAHVSPGLEPEFVVEKTPTGFDESSLDLRRKRECFPDAWYLHIVRDGEAVTRSLMRAPWMGDRSAAACARHWRRSVDSTRECLGDHPRYREVRYEALCDDPAGCSRDLFRWLGLESGKEILETVRTLSREQFSDLGAVPANTALASWATAAGRGRLSLAHIRTALDRARRQLGSSNGSSSADSSALAFDFARALRERDKEAVRSLTAKSLALEYRGPDGDVVSRGDEAREVVLGIVERLFARRHVSEWWASSGGPSEWWTWAPGQPFWTIFFSALSGDATRVDLAFGLVVENEQIVRMVVMSVGSLAGRPVRQLSAASVASPPV